MIYKKPSDIKYTEMAMYIDNNFWTEGKNDDLCYKYMRLLIYMVACKGKMFANFQDYEDFSSISTSTLYERFLKRRKKMYEEITTIIDSTWYESANKEKLLENILELKEREQFNKPNLFDEVCINENDAEETFNSVKDCLMSYSEMVKEDRMSKYDFAVLLSNTGILFSPKLKSVLNYIKSCIVHLKTTYQEKTFNQVFDEVSTGDKFVAENFEEYKMSLYSDQPFMHNEELVRETFSVIGKFCKDESEEMDYLASFERKNLYLSLLLSFLNLFTFSNNLKDYLDKKSKRTTQKDFLKILKETNDSASNLIIYGLSDTNYNLVKESFEKVKKRLKDNLKDEFYVQNVQKEALINILDNSYISAAEASSQDEYA